MTAGLIYAQRKDQSTDTLEWEEMVAGDRWAESLEVQLLAASVYPLGANMGDLTNHAISAHALKSHGSGAVTEIVADWLVSWSLTDHSKVYGCFIFTFLKFEFFQKKNFFKK